MGGSADMKTLNDSASYAMGVDLANNLTEAKVSLNADLLTKGYEDAMAKKALLSDEKVQRTLSNFSKQVREKQAGEALGKEKTFLETCAKEPGVQKTASGLMYKVEKEGSGKMPKATDNVTVHYEGKLTNGEVFDSSYKRGEPTSFQLNQVIPGWTEGVQLMKEGAIYTFYIPSAIAYGERGGGPIPPNEPLTFKVELIKVGK